MSGDVPVTSVDVGCERCGQRLDGVSVQLVSAWAEGHRGPVLLAVELRLDGQSSRWVRR